MLRNHRKPGVLQSSQRTLRRRHHRKHHEHEHEDHDQETDAGPDPEHPAAGATHPEHAAHADRAQDRTRKEEEECERDQRDEPGIQAHFQAIVSSPSLEVARNRPTEQRHERYESSQYDLEDTTDECVDPRVTFRHVPGVTSKCLNSCQRTRAI